VLLDAFARLDVDEVPHRLVLAGPPGWKPDDDDARAADALGDRVRLLGPVGRDHVFALLAGAELFAFPSRHEGFGIPVLEAMACGTPVVTSRGGATEEVAGGAAVLVDPRDPASIAGGIEEAERRRESLVEVGRARASMFTWHRSADVVEDLWRELA
jgi:glycosyltransferase involved in cell wall biosynthesis